MMSTLIISLSVTIFTLAVFSILRWIFVGHELNLSQRLAKISKDKKFRPAEIPLIIKNDDLSQIPLLNRLLQKLQVFKNLRRVIKQANLPMKVGELVLLSLAVGGISLILTLETGNIILVVIWFVLSGSIPLAYVFYRRRKRLKLFEEQLPDALDMMMNAIRAGFAFDKAIQLVAEEEPDPIAMEFRKACEELNFGLPMKDVLLNLTKRIDSIDLKLFATAIIIQRESGGNLTEILTKISSTIRQRFKLLGQIKVFTAQGRFSGWILGTLPIALGVIISTLNPDYIGQLFHETLGHYMLATGVILQIMGVIVINKIVKIKVQ